MTKYTVPINFWGTINATDPDKAWEKVHKAIGKACEAFEAELEAIGLTDVDHLHEELEEEG